MLKELLKAGANPNLANTDGEWTALHAAGFARESRDERQKDAAIGRILLENGAELDRRNAFDYTPLHIAASNGQVELLEVLLESGANLYAKDRENRTPLDLAKEEGQARVVAEIREAQSSSNPL